MLYYTHTHTHNYNRIYLFKNEPQGTCKWYCQQGQHHSFPQLQQPCCTVSFFLPSWATHKFKVELMRDLKILPSRTRTYISMEWWDALTVKLSTVEPTNSIALYVAPATDISPIIYKLRNKRTNRIEISVP